jgi:hypothetical protein
MKGKGLSPTVTRATRSEKSLVRAGTIRRAGKKTADVELGGGDVLYDVPVSGAVKAQQRVSVLSEKGKNTILGAAASGGDSTTVYKTSGVYSGAPAQHALNGPNHTGILAQSQAPWALAADGSVTLVGNLPVQAGVTIDGVDLSAFKAAYDAHNHDSRYLQLAGGALSGPLSSAPFTSGAEGWQIGPDGSAEMASLTLRSSLHAQSFVVDLVSAHIGDDINARSAGTLSEDMAVPASGTWTMTIDDAPGSTALLFDDGDIINAKLALTAIAETWFTVSDGASNGDGTQSYTCTFQSGSTGVTYAAKTGAVDFGVSGQGILISSTRGQYGPYFDVRTHAGSPWAAQTTRLRIGNLRGWDGIASDRYGIGIGDYAGGSYLKYEPGVGLVVKGGGGHVSIEPNGISVATTSSTSDFTAAYVFGSLTSPAGYMRYYTDDIGSGYPKWLDIHHQSNSSGGVRIIADGTTGYSGKQTTLVLHTDKFEVGDSYTSSAGVYEWANRYLHIDSTGVVIDGGLNLGTATSAGEGELKASGSGSFAGGINIGTASGAGTGQIKASGDVFAAGKEIGLQEQIASGVVAFHSGGFQSLTTTQAFVTSVSVSHTPSVNEIAEITFCLSIAQNVGTAACSAGDALAGALSLYYSGADHSFGERIAYATGNTGSQYIIGKAYAALTAGVAYQIRLLARNISGARGAADNPSWIDVKFSAA